MLEKYFVPSDRALKLKKLGFDEKCFGAFYEDNEVSYGLSPYSYCKDIIKEYPLFTLALTFSQAFDWFRENYWFDYSIKPVYGSKNKNKFRCNVYINGKLLQVMKQYFPDNPYFDTREEAELACLDKLIEIAENNETK